MLNKPASGDLSDPPTFAAAYRDHRAAVYGAAYRVVQNAALAQDVTQDVFLRVWRDPAKFDGRRGELGGYLRLMARSRAVDLWREAQARGRVGDRVAAALPAEVHRAADERPDVVAERRVDRAAIHAVVRELPVEQREAVVLTYWGDMTAAEVARHADVPLGTAKSRIRLGLAKLREQAAA